MNVGRFRFNYYGSNWWITTSNQS